MDPDNTVLGRELRTEAGGYAAHLEQTLRKANTHGDSGLMAAGPLLMGVRCPSGRTKCSTTRRGDTAPAAKVVMCILPQLKKSEGDMVLQKRAEKIHCQQDLCYRQC